MPYKDPRKERACARRRYERITAQRTARGMCPKCGVAKPVPDRTLCRPCGEKRRKAERARHAKAKAAGLLYGGRDAERCRRSARDRSKQRDRARRDAGLCTRCGTNPPLEGGTVCEPCQELKRESEREHYARRRAAGECGECGAPAPDGSARCERCARSAAKHSRKRRRMQGAASSTLNGGHEGFVQTAAHHPRARRDVLRAPAGPGRVRASIAVCRSCHRNSRSSRLPPEQIMGHGKTWLRWRLAWPSPGSPPARSRS